MDFLGRWWWYFLQTFFAFSASWKFFNSFCWTTGISICCTLSNFSFNRVLLRGTLSSLILLPLSRPCYLLKVKKPSCPKVQLEEIDSKVSLQWVPYHCDIDRNKKTYLLAFFLIMRGCNIIKKLKGNLSLDSWKLQTNRAFRYFFCAAAANTSRNKPWSILSTRSFCIRDFPTALLRLPSLEFGLRTIAFVFIFFVLILSTLLCVLYFQPGKVWLLRALTNSLHYIIVIVEKYWETNMLRT